MGTNLYEHLGTTLREVLNLIVYKRHVGNDVMELDETVYAQSLYTEGAQ